MMCLFVCWMLNDASTHFGSLASDDIKLNMFWMEKVKMCKIIMTFKMTSSFCRIFDRKDHVQYLQFQRAIPDDCT